jgi:TRAP-type C4-dicarboxylate transport system permease small subunit
MFDRLEKAGAHAEDALLIVILISMIFLAGTQIVLRNFLDNSIFWADEMLRVMVLWLTMAGALAASRVDKHISIAVLNRFLPGRVQLITKVIIDVFTASVCALFAWHSARFVMGSYEYGDVLMRSIPAWTLQIILPIGFTLMAYRHLVIAIRRPFVASRGPKGHAAGGDQHP